MYILSTNNPFTIIIYNMNEKISKGNVLQNNVLMLTYNENYADINISDNSGVLYKKPNQPHLFWKSKENETEVNLSHDATLFDSFPNNSILGKVGNAITTTVTTDLLPEGTNNKYFTTAAARNSISAGAGVIYDSDTGVISSTMASASVLSLTGTANQIIASSTTGDITLSLPQNIHSESDVQFKTITLNSMTQPLVITNSYNGTAEAIKITNTSNTNTPATIGFYQDTTLTSAIKSYSDNLLITTSNPISFTSNKATFNINSVEKLTLTSTGIGINEPSPVSLFQITNVGNDPSTFPNYSLLLYNSGSSATSVGLGCDSNHGMWFNAPQFSHYINATEVLTITSTGVGIGTNTPSSLLHLSSTTADAKVILNCATSHNASYILSQNDGEKFSLLFDDATQSFNINQQSIGNVLTINGANVGINNQNPSAKFHITAPSTARQFAINNFFDISADAATKITSISSNAFIYNDGVNGPIMKYTNTSASYGATGILYNYPNANELTIYNSASTSSTSNTAFQPKQLIRVTAASSIIIGTGDQLDPAATEGFLCIPSCNGPPTGTPDVDAGSVPIICDTANNRIYIYNGSWKYFTLN